MDHNRPIVLGINRTQDASICLTDGTDLICAVQKERLTRFKHHWGRVNDLRNVYLPQVSALDTRIDVIVECFSSDAEARKLAVYEQELVDTLAPRPGCRRARISHHLAHLYSVFFPSPFEEAAVMIIDGQGSHARDFTEAVPGVAVPGHWREVASFYRASRRRVDCLAKQMWDRNDERLVGLGMFYFLLTQAIFPGDGNEGKVMGLAPHGDPHALGLPPLEVHAGQVFIPPRWLEIVHQEGRFRYAADDTSGARFTDIANLAAAGQLAFEQALIEIARWLHEQTGLDDLCFAGGTALNCSANARLLRETPFQRLFVAPSPGDGGTAIGCAMYGVRELLGAAPAWRWTDDYLGPGLRPAEVDAAVATATDCVAERCDELDHLARRMVDLLCEGRVIALCQGRSEFGPRALGHRSILADPRRAATRDWINARVKQREWFRPLAPVVLAEEGARYFDLQRDSPFMQFATAVRPEASATLAAVTHVDGTARVQTVPADGDPLLRAVLCGFAARTGVGVLLNTSFNRREEPIVQTPAEAVTSFLATPLHALAMPPWLLHKRTLGEAAP